MARGSRGPAGQSLVEALYELLEPALPAVFVASLIAAPGCEVEGDEVFQPPS